MPIRFSYDERRRILFTTADGVLSLAEIRKHLRQEADAKALDYPELFDATDATTDLTSADVKILVKELKDYFSRGAFGPTAVVTANDVVFGMARMMSILSEIEGGPAIGVFRDISAGLDWLIRFNPA